MLPYLGEVEPCSGCGRCHEGDHWTGSMYEAYPCPGPDLIELNDALVEEAEALDVGGRGLWVERALA